MTAYKIIVKNLVLNLFNLNNLYYIKTNIINIAINNYFFKKCKNK